MREPNIERSRHDTAYMKALGADLIPDPTTAGDFCRRFTEDDVVALMAAINAVCPKLWAGRGQDLLGPVAYIDADGTIAPTSGRHKAGMDISYKGIWVSRVALLVATGCCPALACAGVRAGAMTPIRRHRSTSSA